jgi:hypothetical protein
LIESVLDVARASGEIGDGAEREYGIVLNFKDAGFGEILKDLHDGGNFGSTNFLRCSLERSVSHEFLWERFEESVTGEGASVKAKSGAGIGQFPITWYVSVHNGTDLELRPVYHRFEALTCNPNRREK